MATLAACAVLGLLLIVGKGAEARITAEEVALWNNHVFGVSQSGQQVGKVTELGSGKDAIDAYVAVPSGGKPTAAVILFTDIKGWEFNNTRLWADRLAKAGFLAVLPDFFRGDEVGNDTKAFISRQPKERVLKDFETVVAAVKKSYPSVKKIGQQGFCWGGYYTGILSTGKAPKVDAAVAFHASLLKPADIDAITGPVSFQQSDPTLDAQINTTFYNYIEKAFTAKRAKGGRAYITNYPGMPHGYALRGNLSDPAWAKASTTAFDEGVKFLKEYLLASPVASPGAAPSSFFKSPEGKHSLSAVAGSGATLKGHPDHAMRGAAEPAAATAGEKVPSAAVQP